jgi:flagellar protein FliS
VSARDHLARYQESQVLTASREQLLLLTYDGLLRFLARARRGMEAGDYYQKHFGISRAQGLIIELRRTLDFTAAPELAHNLARIYTYLLEQLTLADAEDDGARIEHVIELVTELRGAWLDLARQAAASESEAPHS